MTLITFKDGKPVMRDGLIGTEHECCCGGGGDECTAWLKFTACYGSGASAYATLDESGSVSGVTLVNAGSGYATPFRVEPTLTISGSGTGATFTPTLTPEQYPQCGLARWWLDYCQIAVSGGTGYTEGETLTISVSENDTVVQHPVVTLYVGREAPTLTLAGNATTTVNLGQQQPDWWTAGFWYISSVTVTSGGSGYTEGQSLAINKAATDIELVANSGTARVVHSTPANAVVSILSGSGSGAVLQPLWQLLVSSVWPAPHKRTYRLSGFTVVNGGTGYQNYETINISFASPSDGTVLIAATVNTGVVGSSGEILSVNRVSDGRYVGSQTDALHSVGISTGPSNGGRWYKPNGVPREVKCSGVGIYYGEDESAAPHKASVSAVLPSALLGQGGVAASFAVSVGDDGGISGLTVSGAGSGYTRCCGACNGAASSPCACCLGELSYGCGDCEFTNASVEDEIVTGPNQHDVWTRQAYLWPTTAPLIGDPQWASGYPEAIAQCWYRWGYYSTSQKFPYQMANGCFSYRSFIRHRLFVVDCKSRTVIDITDQALTQPLEGTVCAWGPIPQYVYEPCQDSNAVCNQNNPPNPGFLTLSPALSCP